MSEPALLASVVFVRKARRQALIEQRDPYFSSGAHRDGESHDDHHQKYTLAFSRVSEIGNLPQELDRSLRDNPDKPVLERQTRQRG